MIKEKPCVYCILCPDTKEVVYVGMTYGRKGRFKRHLVKNNTNVSIWIQSILLQGKTPIFKIIKEFRYKKHKNGNNDNYDMANRVSSFEDQTIRSFSKIGYRLQNIHCHTINRYNVNGKLTMFLQPNN